MSTENIPDVRLEDKELIKVVVECLRKRGPIDTHQEALLRKIKRTMEKAETATGEEKMELENEISELTIPALFSLSLSTHQAIGEAVSPDFRPLIIEMAKRICAEVGKPSTSQIALIHTLVSAYGRVLELSHLVYWWGMQDRLASTNIAYISFLGKELDRATRQFYTGYSLLRHITAPPIQVHVKAKSAFISNEQQLNNINYEQPSLQ